MRLAFVLVACLFAGPVAAADSSCWYDAERAYGVSAELLYAIARAESNLNPAAMNLSHKARTGTYDIGLMQINSGHLPRLSKHGISEKDLLDACTNIKVGAWLLAGLFAKHGVSWNAVGAYNAACSTLKGADCQAARSKYAWRVYQRLPGQPEPAHKRRVRPQAQQQPAAPATQTFILAARVSPR